MRAFVDIAISCGWRHDSSDPVYSNNCSVAFQVDYCKRCIHRLCKIFMLFLPLPNEYSFTPKKRLLKSRMRITMTNQQ